MNAMTDIVLWPKWCYLNNPMENEAKDLVLNINNNNIKEKELNSLSISRIRKKHRDITGSIRDNPQTGTGGLNGMPKDVSSNVKAERLSPEQQRIDAPSKRFSPTPSSSPKSPASHRTRTPSFAGTPPNPAFTPPTSNFQPTYDRFSPAALAGMGGLPPGTHAPVKQMESLITRNCSDLMRSLAAKYNNSNPNDYFSSPNNGLVRPPIPNLGNNFKGSNSAFMGIPSPTSGGINSVRDIEKKNEMPVTTVSPCLPQGLPTPPGGPPLFPTTSIPGFTGFPLVDMSSTQVLLNMVRNASVNQQSQLENYLRGALKRPAEAHTSPLDLSSSVTAKRPRMEAPKSFDIKNFFSPTPEDEKKHSDKLGPTSPISNSNGTSLAKPHLSSPNSAWSTKSGGILCNDQNCPSLEAIFHWTVEDVCNFVGSIDLCSEYVEAFKDQRIDGSALPLLTEEHLTTSINMKLGPALKLRSALARKLGSCNICLHCSHCHSLPQERRPNSASSNQ